MTCCAACLKFQIHVKTVLQTGLANCVVSKIPYKRLIKLLHSFIYNMDVTFSCNLGKEITVLNHAYRTVCKYYLDENLLHHCNRLPTAVTWRAHQELMGSSLNPNVSVRTSWCFRGSKWYF